jgi:hypothetical protein
MPSGNTQTDSWSLTNSWGFRFAKGMAKEGVTGMAVSAIRLNLAIGTGGMSEMHIQIVTRAYAAYEGYSNGGVVGSVIDAYNVGNPLNQFGEMGARLYLAIESENPEKMGAASLPVAMAVVGAVAGKAMGGGGAPRAGAAQASIAEGSFSIIDWSGYPANIPRPTGPFRLLTGAEYELARGLANRANAQLRRANPGGYAGSEIHELHPVKFAGDPEGLTNKVALPTPIHRTMTVFWNKLMRDVQ